MTSCLQHCSSHQRCCCLAICSSDAEHWTRSACALFLEVVGQFNFRRNRQTHLSGSRHHRMAFGNSGCRGETTNTFHNIQHCCLVRCVDKFAVQTESKLIVLFRSLIITENHTLSPLMKSVRDCHPCHTKTKHQSCLLGAQRRPA